MGDKDEIIIKRKGDKDSKVTIEIKDGQVFINGKPADDFDDDNLIIRRKRSGDEDMLCFALHVLLSAEERGIIVEMMVRFQNSISRSFFRKR